MDRCPSETPDPHRATDRRERRPRRSRAAAEREAAFRLNPPALDPHVMSGSILLARHPDEALSGQTSSRGARAVRTLHHYGCLGLQERREIGTRPEIREFIMKALAAGRP